MISPEATAALEHPVCIAEKANAVHAAQDEGDWAGMDLDNRAKAKGGGGGRTVRYWALMACSSVALVVGLSSGTLLGRLYFVNGGSRRWVYTWVESAGWPVVLLPLGVSYWRQGAECSCACAWGGARAAARVAVGCGVIGCLTAVDNLLYAWGLSYLPVSTNAIVSASQLVFNAAFARVLVGQRFTAYSVNAIALITTGTVLLGASASTDRPAGTSPRQYAVGVVVTVAASALYALILPMLELLYRTIASANPAPLPATAAAASSGRHVASFSVVMVVQVAVSAVASCFAAVGMLAGGDLPGAMIREASSFALGPSSYCLTLAFSALAWQLYLLGCSGLIFLASSLMSCVFMTAMIPFLPILAVLFFHDNFSLLKAISMLLSTWGFVSYLYGAYVTTRSSSTANPTSLQNC